MSNQDTHDIKLINRNVMIVTGVVKIESFDSERLLLETVCGYLVVDGANLEIKDFNECILIIEGKIDSTSYWDDYKGKQDSGLFGRLFR